MAGYRFITECPNDRLSKKNVIINRPGRKNWPNPLSKTQIGIVIDQGRGPIGIPITIIGANDPSGLPEGFMIADENNGGCQALSSKEGEWLVKWGFFIPLAIDVTNLQKYCESRCRYKYDPVGGLESVLAGIRALMLRLIFSNNITFGKVLQFNDLFFTIDPNA